MTSHNSQHIKDSIIALSHSYGFDLCHITNAEQPQHISDYFLSTIDKRNDYGDFYGTMGWMVDRAPMRSDIKNLWAETKSVIILGLNYYNGCDSLDYLNNKNIGLISCYAHGEDYHDIIKKKLKQMASQIAHNYDCQVKLFVDTAPILEKPLAHQSGIGWQGKHSNLVSRDFGSWLFLSEIFTDLDLPLDNALDDHCGNCRQCIDICPTQAIETPYRLTVNKCISYWTIEHKGIIPDDIAKNMGNRIYGCDDCLAICPWNKFAKQTNELKFYDQKQRINLSLIDYLKLDDAGFRALFSKSPVKRIGWQRFIRNCCIAAGNSHDSDLLPILEIFGKCDDAVIAHSAKWALTQY